jgi:hypothetical protein
VDPGGAAQTLALKLQAAESNPNGLKEQCEITIERADEAKTAVQRFMPWRVRRQTEVRLPPRRGAFRHHVTR